MNLLNQIEMADSKTLNSYEYAIESIPNSMSGKSQTEEMLKIINKYTVDGWKVHTIYSNELGKNAVAFMGVGVNSTQSEDIIIFERHVQYNVTCHIEKDLLVTNYCSEIPVRFGIAKMWIPQNTNNFMLAIAGKYGVGISMEAFRVDAEFVTIFDERIPVKNISFITKNKGQSDFVTEPYEIEMNKNEIKLIRSVKIYIRSYVADGKAHAVNDVEYIDVNEDAITFSQKQLFGQEYFSKFSQNEIDWVCVCGKHNSLSEGVCPICGRKKEALQKNERFDLRSIIEEAETKKTAKDIYSWLIQINETECNEIIANIILGLESVVKTERLYGNEKESAMRKLKSYLEKE